MEAREVTVPAGPHGQITGTVTSNAAGVARYRRFLNVPYAQSPVGDLRWRAPVALPDDYPWNDVDGTAYGPIAPQPTTEFKREGAVKLTSHVDGVEQAEGALIVNIWTPVTEPSKQGWPVLVWLHGGWSKIGHPLVTEGSDPSGIIRGANIDVVIVAVQYRLGVLVSDPHSLKKYLNTQGFLSSSALEPTGNFGLLDQRLALEWTAANISIFGGDPGNITLGGSGSGAAAAQLQLAHEINFPVKSLIKRVMQISNSLPCQPKSVEEAQQGFDQLTLALGIPQDTSPAKRLDRLREVPVSDLLHAAETLKLHDFRPVSDGTFVHLDTYARIQDGHFAREFAKRDIGLIIGEVSHEGIKYSMRNAPNTLKGMLEELQNYYPQSYIDKIRSMPGLTVPEYQLPQPLDETNPEHQGAILSVFSHSVTDGLVYVPSRSFVNSLFQHGVRMDRVLRYRIARRPDATDKLSLAPHGKVTHDDDSYTWRYSKHLGFSPEDDAIAGAWLRPVKLFLEGDVTGAAKTWWHDDIPEKPSYFRGLSAEGVIEVVDDKRWDRFMKIIEALK